MDLFGVALQAMDALEPGFFLPHVLGGSKRSITQVLERLDTGRRKYVVKLALELTVCRRAPGSVVETVLE